MGVGQKQTKGRDHRGEDRMTNAKELEIISQQDKIKQCQKRSYLKHKERRKAERKEYYQKNRETILEKLRAKRKETRDIDYERTKISRNKSPRNNISYLLSSKKSKCKRDGVEFNIRIDDLYLPTHCPLLGLSLDYKTCSDYNPNRASIDRIDSSKGYTQGNVWVICLRANMIKNDASIEELQMICDGLQKKISHAK